jgi:hypothetical protein
MKNNKVASSVRAASDDRICATEADVLGLEPVVSRCVGGDVAATSTCLNSLVFAACASVERRREEYRSVQAVIPALGGDSLAVKKSPHSVRRRWPAGSATTTELSIGSAAPTRRIRAGV